MQLLRTINLLLIYQCGMLSSVRATQQLLEPKLAFPSALDTQWFHLNTLLMCPHNTLWKAH